MVSWLTALSGLCSRVDNVLISVAILALTKMADVSDPWSVGHCEVLMGIASLDGTTLKDRPCMWHHSLGGTPRTGANGRVSRHSIRGTHT